MAKVIPFASLLLAFLGTWSCWSARGAEPSAHWAYAPVKRPLPPEVTNRNWPLSAVDYFTLAQMERRGLTPSDDASRETWLRRISLDLLGLPPSPQERKNFLADASPDAYERVIDRLLASPRFGERMAQHWLDLARYADTHGYHSDSHREMWRWRDWVIDAFNRDMPFDQFTIEQLAGDLLPQPTLSQRIATGFHRNTMINFENGAIPEEYRAEYVADRVVTTGTVWLGQTLLCARCHDHKYDPISQRDFYRMFAYFNQVAENGLDGRAGNAVPNIAAPTAEQQAELDRLDKETKRMEKKLASRLASCGPDFQAWIGKQAARNDVRRPPSDAAAVYALDSADDDRIADTGGAGRSGRIVGNPTFVPGRFDQSLLFDGETHLVLNDIPRADRDDPLTLSLWLFPTSDQKLTVLARVDDAFTSRGWSIAIDERRLIIRLRNEAEKNEIEVRSQQPLDLRKWQAITVAYDGSSKASGISVYRNGAVVQLEVVHDSLTASIHTNRPWQLGRRDDAEPFRGLIDEVRLFARRLDAAEIELLAGGDPIGAVLALPAEKRSPEQLAQLKKYFLDHVDATYSMLAAKQLAIGLDREALLRRIPNVMVMQDVAQPRATFVLERGLYNAPGEKVTAEVPRQLFASDDALPANRLGLAKWLVDRRQPLTPRVVVNQYWQLLFGQGLVATPEDFGVRGSPPSHPELLDWLASEFVDSGWNVKHLLRLMVESRTYRQSSRVTPELHRVDPENIWLARGPRFRLPAETIRDAALASSGLLDARMGGPSVNPYQPVDLWKDLAYNTQQYTAQWFHVGGGGDLVRRGVYTFWKRASPHPMLTAFDAPNRETCTVRRPRTNSPSQALVLLNDPTFIEAARATAERVLRESENATPHRIDYAVQLLFGRSARRLEIHGLTLLLDDELRHFRADPASAAKFLAVGESKRDVRIDVVEHAAWTLVVHTLMNLEEMVVRD